MFITRKKLNETIENAVKNREKELYEAQNLRDELRYMHDDISKLYGITHGLKKSIEEVIDKKIDENIPLNF